MNKTDLINDIVFADFIRLNGRFSAEVYAYLREAIWAGEFNTVFSYLMRVMWHLYPRSN